MNHVGIPTAQTAAQARPGAGAAFLWSSAVRLVTGLCLAAICLPLTAASSLTQIAGTATLSDGSPNKRRAQAAAHGPAAPGRSAAIDRVIADAARRYQLDPALLSAIITVESNFNPQAVSPQGAAGLMQLMPRTSKALRIHDPLDPAQNIHGGASLFRHLLDTFEDNLRLALAAYHAGEPQVRLTGELPQGLSTATYVERVLRVYRRLAAQAAR